MIRPRTAAFAGALALSATAASAADLLPPPPIAYPASAPLVEVASGLYLRGDVGVGVVESGKWSQRELDQASVFRQDGSQTPLDGRFLRKGFDDTVFVGVGVGYQFNNWFRADVTAEYRTATNFHGTDSYSFPCEYAAFGSCAGGFPNKVTRNNFYQGSLSSTVVLANGYVDLGTWYGLTPYIGAGVGGAFNKVRNARDFDPSEFGGGGQFDDKSKTSFAWALHAGLGYQINERLKLDIGYRYLHIGDVSTGSLRCFSAQPNAGCDGAGASYGALKFKGVESHDVKLGMRWMLQAPEAPQPVAYSQPLVRKY